MTQKKYTLPITGTVIQEEPLKGDSKDPIRPIEIIEKEAYNRNVHINFSVEHISLDSETAVIMLEADDSFHEWLESEINSTPNLHDLVTKHGCVPLKKKKMKPKSL